MNRCWILAGCLLGTLSLTAKNATQSGQKPQANSQLTAPKASVANTGALDSRAYLQAILDSGKPTVTIPRRKEPWLISGTLNIPSNIQVSFEDGAEIRAMKNCFKGTTDCLLSIRNQKNVTLRGKGILTMNKRDYQNPNLYKKAEWRHTLIVSKAQNISISGLTLRQSGGDGIYLNDVKDVAVDGVTCQDNHRQGLSVISAENLMVKNSIFTGTDGTAPMAGVDFEPNHPHEKMVNCVMENCTFTNNRGAGILFAFTRLTPESTPISIHIRNCHVDGNHWGILNENMTPSAKGAITIDNCTVRHSTLTSFMTKGMAATSYGITLKDTLLDQTGATADAPIILTGESVQKPLGNLHVQNLRIQDSRPRTELFRYTQWRLNALENMTGILVHSSGKTYDLADAVAYSQANPPARNAILDCQNLKPGSPRLKTQQPIRPIMIRSNRTQATFLQAAKAGQTVTVNLNAMPIGKRPAMSVTVQSPSGKLLGSQTCRQPVPPATIRFTAAETGIHQIHYQGTFGVQLASDRPGNGIQVNQWTGFFSTQAPVRMYFQVPAGTRTVQVAARGSHPREWLHLQLLDPRGQIQAEQKHILDPTVVEATRANPQQDEIWSIAIPTAIEDFSLAILGDSVPILSTTPEAVLIRQGKPAAKTSK